MNPRRRDRFDELLQDVIDGLPPRIHALIDEVPVVVLDSPTPEMVRSLKAEGTLGPEDTGDDLCGLHTGVGMPDRSIEDPGGWGPVGGGDSGGPEQVHIFRDGIVSLAGGWEHPEAEEDIYEEIRITLLHELGHHFGLDEDDLEELGYA
jgi:predicted Zn-dependent protease with MMP-like domain